MATIPLQGSAVREHQQAEHHIDQRRQEGTEAGGHHLLLLDGPAQKAQPVAAEAAPLHVRRARVARIAQDHHDVGPALTQKVSNRATKTKAHSVRLDRMSIGVITASCRK